MSATQVILQACPTCSGNELLVGSPKLEYCTCTLLCTFSSVQGKGWCLLFYVRLDTPISQCPFHPGNSLMQFGRLSELGVYRKGNNGSRQLRPVRSREVLFVFVFF